MDCSAEVSGWPTTGGCTGAAGSTNRRDKQSNRCQYEQGEEGYKVLLPGLSPGTEHDVSDPRNRDAALREREQRAKGEHEGVGEEPVSAGNPGNVCGHDKQP